MRLTPLEWGLRAPITPRLGENCWRYRAVAKSEPNEEKQTGPKHKTSDTPVFWHRFLFRDSFPHPQLCDSVIPLFNDLPDQPIVLDLGSDQSELFSKI